MNMTVRYLAWSQDGMTVAVSNKENVVSVVDVRKNKIFKTHKMSHEVRDDADRRDLPHTYVKWDLRVSILSILFQSTWRAHPNVGFKFWFVFVSSAVVHT